MKLVEVTTRVIDLSEVEREIRQNENPRERPYWQRFMKELKQKGTCNFFNRRPKSDKERIIRRRFQMLCELYVTEHTVTCEFKD